MDKCKLENQVSCIEARQFLRKAFPHMIRDLDYLPGQRQRGEKRGKRKIGDGRIQSRITKRNDYTVQGQSLQGR